MLVMWRVKIINIFIYHIIFLMYSKNTADNNINKYLIFRIKNNKILIYQACDHNNYRDKSKVFKNSSLLSFNFYKF